MKLWVLEHNIAKVTLYLTPDGTTCDKLKDALKFNTVEAALEYCETQQGLFKFSPQEYTFEFEH